MTFLCEKKTNYYNNNIDNTGTIDFNEFTGLWKYIEDWQRCFRTFDTDGSGNIDARELKTALQTFGYNLSERFVAVLIQKFDRYGRGNITFDNFVQACATIRALTMAFQRFDTDRDGVIQITYEQVCNYFFFDGGRGGLRI